MELLNNYKIVYIEKINKINKSIYNIITMFISIKHFDKLLYKSFILCLKFSF